MGLRYMNAPIFVKTYLIKTTVKDMDLDQLKRLKSFPSFVMTDYLLMKGEYQIAGNLKLDLEELEFQITVGKFWTDGIPLNGLENSFLQW